MEAMAMAFKVKSDGEIECETAEEALALSRLISKSAEPARTAKDMRERDVVASWDELRYRRFVNDLSVNQQKFLDALLTSPNGKTDAELKTYLELENNMAIGGITAGLSKSVKSLGIATDNLITKTRFKDKRGKVIEYRLADAFRVMAERSGGLRKRA
jgi:hypothetical protein